MQVSSSALVNYQMRQICLFKSLALLEDSFTLIANDSIVFATQFYKPSTELIKC